MNPANDDNSTAAERASFGAGLDDLINRHVDLSDWTDLIAALEGRAAELRRLRDSVKTRERAGLAQAWAEQRQRAVELVALATHLHPDHVSDMLRGEQTPYESRRTEVLAEAGQLYTLREELDALRRFEAARAPAPPAAVPLPSPRSAQPITIGMGK